MNGKGKIPKNRFQAIAKKYPLYLAIAGVAVSFIFSLENYAFEKGMVNFNVTKEDFLWAVDQSQTDGNVADHQRMKMDNVEVIDQEENDSFEKEHSMLKEIAVFGLIVLIVAATVLIFGKVYVEYFLLS